MPRWTCPRCDREFSRAHQSHTCVPGCTVDAAFAGHPAQMRAVYDAIMAHLLDLAVIAVPMFRPLRATRLLRILRSYNQNLWMHHLTEGAAYLPL